VIINNLRAVIEYLMYLLTVEWWSWDLRSRSWLPKMT